jgi:hypothetical protein
MVEVHIMWLVCGPIIIITSIAVIYLFYNIGYDKGLNEGVRIAALRRKEQELLLQLNKAIPIKPPYDNTAEAEVDKD